MYKLISNNFTMNEIRLLCEKYGIQFDDIRGETLQSKALALFDHARRRRKESDLAMAAADLRPDLDWSPWGGPLPVLTLHQALREMLSAAFNSSDIRTAAFDLGFDDLPSGVGKATLINSLVDYAVKTRKEERLLLYTQNNNPVRYREWYNIIQRAREAHIEAAIPLVTKSQSKEAWITCPHCNGTGKIKQ